MADYDPSHSGHAPEETGPADSPAPLWETTVESVESRFGDGLGSAPAIADGALYAATGGGDVLAMDATTGEVAWQIGTDFYISSGVAIGDEQLFVGAGDNHVHAFDRETGDRNWEHPFRSSVNSSVIHTDGLVIAYPEYGSLTALEPELGETVWEYDGGSGYTPSVRDGSVYVPSAVSDCGMWSGCDTTAGIDVLDVETGEQTAFWPVAAETGLTSTPTIDDRNLYVTAEGGAVYAVSLESTEVVWEASMAESVGSVPTVADVLVTSDTDGTVYGFETDDGAERFSFDAGTAVTGTCVASDTLYVGAERGADGAVYALDPASGERRWQYDLQSPVTTSPVVVDGAVCVGTDDESLRVLVAESAVDTYETSENGTASD